MTAMARLLSSLTAALALTLAACSAEPEPTAPADQGEQEAVAPSADVTRANLGRSIPARFHGVWDNVDGTCARESDLRMEIGSDAVQFYESHGIVTDMEQSDDQSAVVTLAMEGEGEKWNANLRLSLAESGTILEVDHEGAADTGMAILRKRCDD